MRRKEREIKDLQAIKEIFMEAVVCRVAFAVGSVPYIVTLNFGISGDPPDAIWFHCAPSGRKIDMMRQNNKVCFALDCNHNLNKGERGCDWGMNYRSITGYGILSEVEDEKTKLFGLDRIMDHYRGEAFHNYDAKVLSRTKVLKLEIVDLSAKEA